MEDTLAVFPAQVEVPMDVFAGGYGYLASGFWYKNRQAGEHIGYTWYHLPKRDVAKFAIFAARIALSSLLIRLRLI